MINTLEPGVERPPICCMTKLLQKQALIEMLTDDTIPSDRIKFMGDENENPPEDVPDVPDDPNPPVDPEPPSPEPPSPEPPSPEPPSPEPPSPEPPSPDEPSPEEPPSPEPPSPEPPSPEPPSPEPPSPEPPESGSSSLSESKSESTSSSKSSSGSDPWNGETRKIDRWLAKCGEVQAGEWFLKRGGTYTLTYKEYLKLLSVANFTGLDVWMCRGNPGDTCNTGEILVESGKDPGKPPWECIKQCEAPMLMRMGFYNEVVRMKHHGFCYVWQSELDYNSIKRGDWYVEAYTYQDYAMYPINVYISIVYAEPYIMTEWDDEKQEEVQYDDGVSWMPYVKGLFKFDVPVPVPLNSCCINNFTNPIDAITKVDAWWYSDRDDPPPLSGNWGWVAGDYQCWALQEDTTGAYWISFERDYTEE